MFQPCFNTVNRAFACVLLVVVFFQRNAGAGVETGAATNEGAVLKKVVDIRNAGPNLVKPGSWQKYQAGFEDRGGAIVCDNGTNRRAQSGAVQHFELNQAVPSPIVVSAWCRTQGVDGSRDRDFSIYVDLIYADGSPLWGQIASFSVGTHGDERQSVTIFPEKPVKSVAFYLLLRNHAGRAFFHDPELRVIATPSGITLFDSVPVMSTAAPSAGFQIRDAAANSDFLRIEHEALGIRVSCKTNTVKHAITFDVTATSLTTNDRAITLTYAMPVEGGNWEWLGSFNKGASKGVEQVFASSQAAGMGRLSRLPFGAISDGKNGRGLGIDMQVPAFFRVGFNPETHELFLAYDLGFTPEKPEARLRFVLFEFDPAWKMRSALARYYELFPGDFNCRIPDQGLWMPFAKISSVPHYEDFGFRFKEGADEPAWDSAHHILTFRYTEPLTWWMPMPAEMPRTIDAAWTEARRLAQTSQSSAQAFLTSAYANEKGAPIAALLNTPWCNGAVWSINSAPGIAGQITDFKDKWNSSIREKYYTLAPGRAIAGEYVDSSEGYITDTLDFRRDHFGAMQTPLTFSPDSRRPAIFRGLIAFEYVRAISGDVHAMNKFAMANSTPNQLCWLAPLLDVLGTESDWNRNGAWTPMSEDELLYRRALCRAKPFCFLLNTDFNKLSPQSVEKYMQRCLAYGMFPGFFSADASTQQYFSRPQLFERDRPLFKKYIPLCQRVAKAGWEPLTGAQSSDALVQLERFGSRYLTVFNSSASTRTPTITLEFPAQSGHELLTDTKVDWKNHSATLTLAPESVAVIDLENTP